MSRSRQSDSPHRRTRRRVRKKVALYAAQYGRCFYCGRRVGLKAFTFDHVVPVSKRGRNTIANIVGACRDCNEWKADDQVDPQFVCERRAYFAGQTEWAREFAGK